MMVEKGGSNYLEILHVFRGLIDPNKVFIERKQPHPPLSPDFLKIFDRTSGFAIKGDAILVVDRTSHSLHFERYGSDGKGSELSRLFFRGDYWTGNQVVVTTAPDRFQVGVIANWDEKQIPLGDWQTPFLEPPPTFVLADRSDLKQALATVGGLVRVDVIDMKDTNSRREVTIFDRKITDPFLAIHRRETRHLNEPMDPSTPIGETRVLSRGTVTEIMNQLDPRIPWEESFKKPARLKPSYRPAQEIAHLIIDTLSI